MNSNEVIFFTGAGISRSTGIKTFQEIPGIRQKLVREYANEHPEEYRDIVYQMVDQVSKVEPTIAHKAISDFGAKVITMNVDGLHGSDVIEMHGSLPKEKVEDVEEFFEKDTIVLYNDIAPNYPKAIKAVEDMPYGSALVIVGVSFYTMVSWDVFFAAIRNGMKVFIVDPDAENIVRHIFQTSPGALYGFHPYGERVTAWDVMPINKEADIGVPEVIEVIKNWDGKDPI